MVAPQQRIPEGAESALERFLTARWGLYTQLGAALAFAPVQHPPWPLYRAQVVELEDEFVAAAGYPASPEEPLVHYSPGVDVRIGLPRRVQLDA